MTPYNREHWSFSQINQFLRICPLQYAFQRVYGLVPEFVSESLPFGSAIHRTAEYFWSYRIDGQDASPDELSELFADLWTREVNETVHLKYLKSDFDTLLKQGQGMIRCYREQFDDDCEIVDFNRSFEVPLIDQDGESLEKPIVGEIDLLIRQKGYLYAVDLKTAAQRYSESKVRNDLQPTVYLYALEMLGHDAVFQFEVLLKTKRPAIERYMTNRTQKDFHRLVELVKLIESMVRAGHFVPNEGSHFCSGCGFQSACRNWHTCPTGSQLCEPATSSAAG